MPCDAVCSHMFPATFMMMWMKPKDLTADIQKQNEDDFDLKCPSLVPLSKVIVAHNSGL